MAVARRRRPRAVTVSARRRPGTVTTESGGTTALAIALAGAVQSFSCDTQAALVLAIQVAAVRPP